jgi:hypothetical protein
MKNIIKFENFIQNINNQIIKPFGEFRKGSNEYGVFIQELMSFLRLFEIENNSLKIETNKITFDLDTLIKLNNDINKNRLISFDIEFLDQYDNKIDSPVNNGFILFTNLNTKINRPWENILFNK